MVPGFNHNIKHNGAIYHIQTEDSGLGNPHIITHLFVGGNILATKKTSYADIVHAENLHAIVKELMQEQHKAMLRNLINGVYDDLAGSQRPEVITSRFPPQTVPQAGLAAKTSGPDIASGGTTGGERPAAGESQPRAPAAALRRETPAMSPTSSNTTAKPTQPSHPTSKAPPPLVPKGSPTATVTPQASRKQATTPATDSSADALPPEVLAARRLSEKPTPKDTTGPTIFGESLISEKSLDEVILGYLAGNEDDG